MRDYFFQIVLLLLGALIGVSIPFLSKRWQKRAAGILALLLVAISFLWAGYELGNSESPPTVVANLTPDVPTSTSPNTPSSLPNATPTSTEASPVLTLIATATPPCGMCQA